MRVFTKLVLIGVVPSLSLLTVFHEYRVPDVGISERRYLVSLYVSSIIRYFPAASELKDNYTTSFSLEYSSVAVRVSIPSWASKVQ